MPVHLQGDLRLSCPLSGQGAEGRAQTRGRRVPADLMVDLLTTVPHTPHIWIGREGASFVQPASGGLLGMSEIQARWFSKLCKGSVQLPSKQEMDAEIEAEMFLPSLRCSSSVSASVI
ncbi:RNA-directed DNA polymerase from mobile element jockey [Plakobranchus ocellatus]|uniref:Flavin-containing monooxygenase n=1 Tax=Plakobranchus ocellatus TaxID=259542 RepID=A0AAV3XWI0_9GAST|nr:RNA-directed DNA polymerase from mobile element jockey [Plakobranchus ocellatus]